MSSPSDRPTGKAEGVRERALKAWTAYLHNSKDQRSAVDVLAAFAESEALLARKEEREACSKAVCQNCANALPVKNSSQWIWIHEVPGIGIGPCHAAAIHSRNQEEGR